MYPPRPTTNDDVAHAKAAIHDLFNVLGRGVCKLVQIMALRHDPHALKSAKTGLEKGQNPR